MSFVLAMSRGASIMPVTLAAETATASDAMGFGDDKMSRPPAEPADGLSWKERLGSGMAKMAARNERVKEVSVDRRIEWRYVLLVPFQTPQAPSVCQSIESAAVKEDGDLRSSVWGDGLGAEGA